MKNYFFRTTTGLHIFVGSTILLVLSLIYVENAHPTGDALGLAAMGFFSIAGYILINLGTSLISDIIYRNSISREKFSSQEKQTVLSKERNILILLAIAGLYVYFLKLSWEIKRYQLLSEEFIRWKDLLSSQSIEAIQNLPHASIRLLLYLFFVIGILFSIKKHRKYSYTLVYMLLVFLCVGLRFLG